MNIRVYFLKPLLVFLFSSLIFACADDTGTPSYTPTSIISEHPQSADCNQGSTATLSVTASGRSLTYQWYINTADSNNGGTPIGGATASSYRLPTGTLGTFYYYVVVTDGSTASAVSNVAVINVISVQYRPIYNAEDLYNIRHNLSADYKLMNNISLSDYSTGPGWEPIGSRASNVYMPFSGSLDGGGYRITDLYVNTVGTPAGIFGYLTGRVNNLGVEIGAGGVTATSSNSSVSRSSYAGGIAGYVDGGAITNSYTTGYVSSTASYTYTTNSSYAGGIAGYVDNGTITNSYTTGYVSSSSATTTSSYSYAGGIAGYVSGGVISGSNSTGYVSSASASDLSSYAGGIAGYVNGTVNGSYSTGDISSTTTTSSSASINSRSSYAGGITGYVSGTVSGSYSTGNISSSNTFNFSYAGGITGYVSGMISGSYSTGDISSTSSSYSSYAGGIAGYVRGIISIDYSTGDISSSTHAGGIAGYIDGIAIMGCYATGNISSRSYAGGIAGYANNVSITGCAAANGYIEATAGGTTYKGRIVGSINYSLAANNFANLSMLVNSAAVSDNTSNGTGKSLAELQTQVIYESAVNGDGLGGLGWEFGNSGGAPVWKMPAGGTGYPVFY